MRYFTPAILLIAIVVATFAVAQDRTNARSMVISPYGIVATSQVLASQAGAEILARGGSAVDAAIAANADARRDGARHERHGRRSIRHLLGRQDRQALRPQCQRMGSKGADASLI